MTTFSSPLLDLAAQPVIAHRGASREAPENTLAAFELALRQGAEALELDVRLSADDAVVVVHDPTLERTTSLTGPVRGRTLTDLRAAAIPSLGEVLWTFPGVPLLVELKEVEARDAVRRLLLKEDAVGRCVLASEQAAALEPFREPPFARAASAPEISTLYWAVLLRRQVPAVRYHCLSVPLRHRGLTVPTGRFVAAARSLGCPVHVWTVNDPATARRLWAGGVAGVVTDLPGVVRAARET